MFIILLMDMYTFFSILLLKPILQSTFLSIISLCTYVNFSEIYIQKCNSWNERYVHCYSSYLLPNCSPNWIYQLTAQLTVQNSKLLQSHQCLVVLLPSFFICDLPLSIPLFLLSFCLVLPLLNHTILLNECENISHCSFNFYSLIYR